MNSKDYEELKAMMKIAEALLDNKETESLTSMETAVNELNKYAADNNYTSFNAELTNNDTIDISFNGAPAFMEIVEVDSDAIEALKSTMDEVFGGEADLTNGTADNDDEYSINKHNIKLIDGIINNTLSAKKHINNDMANVLLKLKLLQKMIREGYDAD